MELYHILFRGPWLRDNMIYTLNQLKEKYFDLYELNVAKYSTRLQILDQRIPYLDCGWSDVVFLSPVHPDKICSALAHYRRVSIGPVPYVVIPISDLIPEQMVVWLFRSREFEQREVVPLDGVLLRSFVEVPDATKAYFEEQLVIEGRPLWFVHVPHVLHKGTIDVSRYPVRYTLAHELTI